MCFYVIKIILFEFLLNFGKRYIQLRFCWFVIGFVRKSLLMSLFVNLLAAFAVLLPTLTGAAAVELGGSASDVVKKDRKAEYAAADKARGIKRANAPCIVWSDANVPTRPWCHW